MTYSPIVAPVVVLVAWSMLMMIWLYATRFPAMRRKGISLKGRVGTTGLLMIGGGVPKNFTQDTVVCAEILGHDDVEVHKYAVQITVADVRDGACSSSTLPEARSWGKVSTAMEQMVFAEATSVLPLLASDAWHRGAWRNREKRRFAKLFD